MTTPSYRCRSCHCTPAKAGMSDIVCYCECHDLARELVDAALAYWSTPLGTPEQQREASRYEGAHTDKARALLARCEKVEG